MKNNSPFGWNGCLHFYTSKALIKDAIPPLLATLALLSLIFITGSDIFAYYKRISDLSCSILPIILALLIAAYAIFLSIAPFQREKKVGLNIKEREEEEEKEKKFVSIKNTLNASFALAIRITLIGLIINVILYLLGDLNIAIEDQTLLQIAAYKLSGILTFFLSFSLYIIKDITINIYNLGVTLILKM